jgi:hypothetical protein
MGMDTVVYDTVYDRLRPYTESVTIDLGVGKSFLILSNKILYSFNINKEKKSLQKYDFSFSTYGFSTFSFRLLPL